MNRRSAGAAAIVWLVALSIALPVGAGVAGVVLPAWGYLPALGGTGFSAEPLIALSAEPGLAQSALLSLGAGVATTAVAVASAAGFIAAFAQTRVFDAVRRSIAPLLAVPHAAAAFGLAFLIAPSGLLFRLAAAALGFDRPPDLLVVGDRLGLAMMAGLVIKEIPFLLLVAIAALPQIDPTQRLRLARSLGFGRMAGFMLAVWPGVYRQIRLPVLAVVAYASSVVDVALILGPSTPSTLAVRIVEWMQDPDLATRFKASAGGLLQLATTGAALLLWIGIERLCRLLCRRVLMSGWRFAADAWLRALAGAPVLLVGMAAFAGIALLALWSVAGPWMFPDPLPASFGFGNWERALAGAIEPLQTSLLIGLLAAGLAVAAVIILLEARRRASPTTGGGRVRLQPAIAALLYLPLIVPQISFVFGLQVLVLGAGLTPSIALLSLVHLIFVVPYVALALADPWYALDPRYERLASSLGHSRLTAFARIRVPLLKGAIAIGFAIGFATSVGQYLPTLLIGAGKFPTITTEAVALVSGANPRVVGIYGLLQALLPLLVFAAAAALAGRRREAGQTLRITA